MSDDIKQYLDPGKKNLILIYILYLGGIVIPLLPIVGAVFAFSNQNINNSLWKSHYVFAFRTFYLGVLSAFIAMFVTFVLTAFLGLVLYMFTFVWFVVRSIIAMQYLLEEKAHPNSLTYWIK